MKSLRSILNKIKSVHYSRKFYKKEISKEQQLKLDICEGCEFNSDCKKVKGIRNIFYKNINKFLNYMYGLKVDVSAFCVVCGCGLMFLTSDFSSEKCKKGKWK